MELFSVFKYVKKRPTRIRSAVFPSPTGGAKILKWLGGSQKELIFMNERYSSSKNFNKNSNKPHVDFLKTL